MPETGNAIGQNPAYRDLLTELRSCSGSGSGSGFGSGYGYGYGYCYGYGHDSGSMYTPRRRELLGQANSATTGEDNVGGLYSGLKQAHS
ncbi:hypothetical protein VTI28DRAFT_4390 [Corynascus sepedonium]